MSRTISLLAASAVLLFSCPPARAVTIQWVPVGNPGNAADPADGDSSTAGIQHFGAVPYAYNIDKSDVTNSQYAEFLNTKDATGANTVGLYNGNMSIAPFAGISYSPGNANGSKYGVLSDAGNHPVNAVNWFDTLRFANWLNNGQGTGDTESGAYTLLHVGSPTPTPTPSNANDITRNAGATVFLPNENEWYKAAYYDPAHTSYYQYPTSSNLVPTTSGPTALANHANYYGGPGFPTDVGAYSGTTSPYGLYDMGGNVWQWNEALTSGLYRGFRGGNFNYDPAGLLSSYRLYEVPSFESAGVGFRMAMVPEPNSAILAALGFVGLIAWAWRRRKRLGPS